MNRIALALVFAVIAACAPPPPATDVDESTRVRVTAYDGKGYCIPDAGVWIERRRGEIAWRAWTDEQGECELRIPSSRWRGALVHVRTRDLREGSAEYDGRSESLQIVVRSARVRAPGPLPIEGAVAGMVLINGEPAGGVPVLLWRDALPPPSLEAARRALDGETIEGLRLTRSDWHGLFRFDVGERVRGWRVCAGGKGWASRNNGSSALTGEATKLHLGRVCGAVLHFRDRGALMRLEEPPTVLSARERNGSFDRRDSFALDDLTLLIAGAQSADLQLDPASWRILLQPPIGSTRLHRQQLDVEGFGFQSLELEFDALPLEGGLPHVEVELQRDESNTGGFGGLRLTLSADDAARTPGALDGELILCDSSGREYSYRAQVGPHAPAWIAFVPRGVFDAQFRAADGRRIEVAAQLEVRAGWRDLELALED